MPAQSVSCASHSVLNHCSQSCTKVQVARTNVQFSSREQLGTLLSVREITNRRREVRTMTIQKQLSHLSFAAIILVFAALPALAQTGSVDNQTVVATVLSKDRVSIPTKESTIVVAPAVMEKQPSFSITQFMKSTSEPTVISDRKVFEF